MPRRKKKELIINGEGLRILLQEIYNQACEERSNAMRLRNRIEKDMKINIDIQVVSKALGDANNLVQASLQKKIMVAKMMLDNIKSNGDGKPDKVPVDGDSQSSKEDLRKMIKEIQDKKRE